MSGLSSIFRPRKPKPLVLQPVPVRESAPISKAAEADRRKNARRKSRSSTLLSTIGDTEPVISRPQLGAG